MDAWIITFLLVFTRIVSLLGTMPVVSASGVPKSVPVMGALSVTVLLVLQLEPVALSADRHLIWAVFTEAALGIAAGLVVRAIFSAAAIASELMSMQMGLQMAQMFDPLQQAQQGPVASVANWIAALLFVSADLHVHALFALSDGLAHIPPGQATVDPAQLDLLLDTVGTAFMLGVQLSGPVLALVFLTNTLVGILGKIAPRMNVFFSVGPTLSSLGGIALFAYALPAFTHGLIDAIAEVVARLPLLLGH